MEETKPCPICKKETTYHDQRYPDMVCKACHSKATDRLGRRLQFSNIDIFGGYKANYADNNRIYDSHVCYINGVECRAEEVRREGGIVIEVWNVSS